MECKCNLSVVQRTLLSCDLHKAEMLWSSQKVPNHILKLMSELFISSLCRVLKTERWLISFYSLHFIVEPFWNEDECYTFTDFYWLWLMCSSTATFNWTWLSRFTTGMTWATIECGLKFAVYKWVRVHNRTKVRPKS